MGPGQSVHACSLRTVVSLCMHEAPLECDASLHSRSQTGCGRRRWQGSSLGPLPLGMHEGSCGKPYCPVPMPMAVLLPCRCSLPLLRCCCCRSTEG